ncbi:hypothetical protein [Azospirillum isscasi]|uniref:Uncharacterized protein n=1 Tax=Azospirillum isscasi TaxID=3053926 RepID=A0ABU0WQQ8_9PROT|nr:hypothetical protein [Azospirillum isscasi]MDQ2106472.1 hypothetical protein [Azospirillum isscasi]
MPDPLDWLADRYAYRPAAIIKLMVLAADHPTTWDAEQETHYRGRLLDILGHMLEIADDTTVIDKAQAFRERFTAAHAMEVQRLVVYLIFLTLPDQGWPEPVTWDHATGRPQVYHLEPMLIHAEAMVLGLLAHRLSELRCDQ